MSKKRYEGILKRPIPEESAADPSKLVEEIAARYAALRTHYGIEGEDNASLLLALARDHVPGFRIEKHRLPDSGILARDVVLLRSMVSHKIKGHTTKRAAELFVREYPGEEISAESARVRYTEMIKKGRRDSSRRAFQDALALILADQFDDDFLKAREFVESLDSNKTR